MDRQIAELIQMQSDRWQRLKKFHSLNNASMKVKHFFMRKEVELLRNGKKELLELKQSKLN